MRQVYQGGLLTNCARQLFFHPVSLDFQLPNLLITFFNQFLLLLLSFPTLVNKQLVYVTE